MNQTKASAAKDIVVTVNCSLEEFYNGSIKQVEYQRNIVQHDAKTVVAEATTQQVEIKPGFSESTELVFVKKGHQSPNCVASNLIVKFKQNAHESYRRVGHNLILTKKVSLLDAFQCMPVSFRTMDDRAITVAVDEQISPSTCKLLEGEGMPVEGSSDKGDLYIKFDIQFPSQF